MHFVFIDQVSPSRLQVAQNAAAHLLTETRKHKHINVLLLFKKLLVG